MKCDELHAGATIAYRLPPHEQPRDPARLWHGRAIAVYPLVSQVLVEVLDCGYEGEEETVSFSQIVEAEEPTLVLCEWCNGYHERGLVEFCPKRPKETPQ